MVLKGILKSSKTKQRLYDKFFESKTYEHEIIYKNYHKLFQSTEESAKSQYDSKMTLHYKANIQHGTIIFHAYKKLRKL